MLSGTEHETIADIGVLDNRKRKGVSLQDSPPEKIAHITMGSSTSDTIKAGTLSLPSYFFTTAIDSNAEQYKLPEYSRRIRLVCHMYNITNSENPCYSSPVYYVESIPIQIQMFLNGKKIPNDGPNRRVMGSQYDYLSIEISVVLKLLNKNVKRKLHWSAKMSVRIEQDDADLKEIFDCSDIFVFDKSNITFRKMIPYELISRHPSFQFDVAIDAIDVYGIIWPSRQLTGYAGIKNEGATCYMNSLLQSLFFTNEFRRIVYNIPVEPLEVDNSFVFALQYIYYALQFGNENHISARNLFDCIAWLDKSQQQDVEECFHRLINELQMVVKGTDLEEQLNKLFSGNIINRIRYLDGTPERCIEEEFHDLQLTVNGNKNIYEALMDYFKEESVQSSDRNGNIVRENAYKRTEIVNLPPVLYIHLMRFGYDTENKSAKKNNDRFEFYRDLDFEQFMAKANPQKTSSSSYTLHSVLAHTGNVSNGHYVAFVNPKGNWYKFNDSIVTSCTANEAINDNYGGNIDVNPLNAYVLVYVKNMYTEEIRKEIPPSEIFNKELIKARMEFNKDPTQLQLISVFTPEILERTTFNHSDALFNTRNQQNFILFQLNGNNTFDDYLEMVRQTFRYNDLEKKIRIWQLVQENRSDDLLMPKLLEYDSKRSETLFQLFDNKPVYLFIELLQIGTSQEITFNYDLDSKTWAIVFLREFDNKRNTLVYFDYIFVKLDEDTTNIIEFVKSAEIVENARNEIHLYQFRYWSTPYEIRNDQKLSSILRRSGNMRAASFIFEMVAADAKPKFLQFINYEKDRIPVTFKHKNTINDVGFTLELPAEMLIADVVHNISEYLKYDFQDIKLFVCESAIDTRSHMETKFIHVDNSINESIRSCFRNIRHRPQRTRSQTVDVSVVFFYDIIEPTLNKRQLSVRWVSFDRAIVKEINIEMITDQTVNQLLLKVRKNENVIFTDNEESTGVLRLLEETNNIIEYVFPCETPLKKLIGLQCYRVEEIPLSQFGINPIKEFLVCIFFYRNSPTYQKTGTSFLIKANNGESFQVFLQRLSNHLHIDMDTISSTEFCIYSHNMTDARFGKDIHDELIAIKDEILAIGMAENFV